MTGRGIHPLKDEQAVASSPRSHIWLSASAGTGKTSVLVARVLRLLLSGVSPERILCLTFTKAGAAEMSIRINDQLARWVQSSDRDLMNDLDALGERSDVDLVRHARTLFARVLDVPGGLAIQTIHGFCQSVLSAFPLEADLVPGFEALEDREQRQLARQALIDMLEAAEASHDATLIVATEMMARRYGEDAILEYLGACVSDANAVAGLSGDVRGRLRSELGIPLGTADDALAKLCADEAIDGSALHRIIDANRAWKTATGTKVADSIAHWLSLTPAMRRDLRETLIGCFLKNDSSPQSVKPGDKAAKFDPDYVELFHDVAEYCRTLRLTPLQIAWADDAAAALHLGREYTARYASLKRARGVVDFDEQVQRTAELLKQPGNAEWIRYKLDQQIDHVLVDESQDTNSAQWDIVQALVEEFFDGEGAKAGVNRTLFAVGDTKQAIYSFQGTSPKAFTDARWRFADKAEQSGQTLTALPLAQSFRTVPAVLEVVDQVISSLGFQALGLDMPPERHRSAQQFPGEVAIWPAIAPQTAPDEDASDESDGWISDADRTLAERIARTIADWIDRGEILKSEGRPVTPGDIMILVRSRGTKAATIVSRLNAAGVPVAGVDRLRLQAPLAVQDLMAAVRFAVQPRDDLNLAALLVSPLLGWTQDDLCTHALREKGVPLWRHLRATVAPEQIQPLRDILAMADFVTPYRFLEQILVGPLEGRRRLCARLGMEANDPINELLNQALLFEGSGPIALQRFVDWFDRDQSEVKREAAEAGDAVRVLTVHGAKGLEAPIVILADATLDPSSNSAKQPALRIDLGSGLVPLPSMPTAIRVPALSKLKDTREAYDLQEHWRLLYVAMTRARERLYLAGALGSRAKGISPEKSWHAAVSLAMRGLGAETQDDRLGLWPGSLVWSGYDQLDPHSLAADHQPEADTGQGEELPDWIRAAAPVESRPPRPLTPSAQPLDDVPYPPPSSGQRAAAERGILIHRLFEVLPSVVVDRRIELGTRWLQHNGGLADERTCQDIVAQVTSVLDDPLHSDLFGPSSLAEAPITAVVDGQVISGTVDRLWVGPDRVTVADFKTGRLVPESLADVPSAHLRQMAAYSAALQVIFPHHQIEARLIYTAGPISLLLPRDMLDLHKPGFRP